MSYRVELSRSGRAVCKDATCKKEGVKIEKNELRFGVWIVYEERGSWAWKHWGCISGKQLQNMREHLSTGPDEYDFNMLDGYDDDHPSGLQSHPDLQEKVRRVITQGFIDHDDWKGDPEMNALGKVGTRSVATKRAMAKEKKEREVEENAALAKSGDVKTEPDVPATPTPAEKKPVEKKRAREEPDDEDEKPIKKKRRAEKSKKRVKEESDDETEKPVKKKRRAVKLKKEEGSEDEVMPAKKSRGKAAKKEEIVIKNEPLNAVVSPIAKEESVDESILNAVDSAIAKEEPVDEPVELTAPVKKPRAKKSAKKAIKEEVNEDAADAVEPKKRRAKRTRSS